MKTMETSTQNGLEKIFWALYDLLYKLITETPFTLILLCLLIFVYYYFKKLFINKYIKSKPKSALPSIIEIYFYDTSSNWNILRAFFRLIQFLAILFLFLYVLRLVGFKLPSGII